MRIEQLTFTRFIAAIAIVIYHFGKYCSIFNNDSVNAIFRNSNVAVSYFFTLSGFVMIIAYAQKGKIKQIDYFKNRFARIYPVYLLAIITMIAASNINTVKQDDLIYNLLMIQSWIPGKALSINYAGWSLSVELFFYALFPYLFSFFTKKGLKTSFIIILSFWLLSQTLYLLNFKGIIKIPIYNLKDIFYHPIFHLNEFLIGILSGLMFLEGKIRIKNNYINSLLFFLTLSVIIIILKFLYGMNYHNGFLAPIFAIFIIIIADSKTKLTLFFTKKVFIFLGEISYSIYILQVPVWTIFTNKWFEKYLDISFSKHDYTASFLVKLTILLIVSSLTYKYLEKPLRSKIKKIGTTKTQLSQKIV